MKLKNTDDVQLYIDYMESLPDIFCVEGPKYLKSFSGMTIIDATTAMINAEIQPIQLRDWFLHALFEMFDILPTDVRTLYYNFFVEDTLQYHGLMMHVFRRFKNSMTKSELIVYKKLLKGKIPKAEKDGEFN